MTDPREVRVARPGELVLLREIESASEALFRDIGIGPFTEDEADESLEHAAVVFVSGEPPVGFASVDIVDDAPHLRQLSVVPSSGRQGRGTALVTAVCAWAAANGHGAVTLTTFRDVPWNAPFYRRLGFEVIDELPPDLAAIRAHERSAGDDDFGPRVAMRKTLGT